MSKTILVIAAHSDDEALGCSGTMAKHISAGDKVHVIFMTNGVGARQSSMYEENKRLDAAQKVAKLLKIASFTNLDFPDNKMDSLPLLDIVKEVENKITEIQPQVIYTHHIGDLNVDHQVTHKAVMTACRPLPGLCVKEIYAFEVLSSTEWQTLGYMPFTPNVFVDIAGFVDIKKQALEFYSKEMRKSPHSRSVDNVLRLNALRGNFVGVDYAEAFVVLRHMR